MKLTLRVFTTVLLGLLPFAAVWGQEAPGVTPEEQKTLTACLPTEAFFDGLVLEPPVRFYDESNLYEYIDGQAEGFIAYDFRALASATYVSGDDSLVIDVYDMAKPVQAFGVYSSFRSPINEFVQIGCQGFKTGEGYIFYKGSMFVNISADYADEDVMFKAAEAAARAVAGNITDSPVGLDMMSLLPSDGKMPNSEKYFLHAVLGQSFLDNGITAQYPYEGGVARLFVCDFGSEDAAAKAYTEYLKFAGAHGEPTEFAPKTAFYAQVKYYGLIEVHLKGRYLAGGVGLPLDKDKLVNSLVSLLPSAPSTD